MWLAAATLLVAVLGSSARAGEPGSERDRKSVSDVRVRVELFQVALVADGKLSFLRQSAALDARGPDVAVAELQHSADGGAPFFDGKPTIVHSTSWRFESEGIVVLTYLAFGERLGPRAPGRKDVRTMSWQELPGLGPTDPDKPRPAVLLHEDVLAHGLRHLALLARRVGNDRFAERLSKSSRAFFAAIEPAIAGKIPAIPRQAR